MKNLYIIYIIFILANSIQLNHLQIQVNKGNIQFPSKTAKILDKKEYKEISKNLLKYFPRRFLSETNEIIQTSINMNSKNTINEFLSEEAEFTTELVTSNKRSEEFTLSTSSDVNNNEPKTSINDNTNFNSIYGIEETSTSNIIGSTESSIGNTELNIGSTESNIGSTESNIGTTESSIGSTESNIESTESNIGSTESNIGTTESSIGSTESNIGSTESNIGTTESSIGSTESNIGSNEPSTSNNDLFKDSLLTSSLNSIDINNTVFLSTIPDNESESITNEIINYNCSLVLLGFSHLNTSNLELSFYIHFALLTGYLASNNLKFPVQITYNNFLRLLENLEANCDLFKELNQNIIYFCKIKTEYSKINNIKIIPEFNFILDRPSSIYLSSIANYYIDNIQQISNKFDNLVDSNIYILTNSKINKKENKTFTINGEIKTQKPKFQKINMTLYSNFETETKINEEQLTCSVIDIKENNYILQCRVNTYYNYIMQNSMSFHKDEILLINFDRYNDSIIKFDKDIEPLPPKEELDSASVLAIIIVIIFFGFLTG